MNNDFMIEIKVKNNLLLSAIRNFGSKTVAEFCRTIDCHSGTVYAFLNLKESPIGKRGKINPIAERICDYLGKEINELFPKEQLENVLKVNKFEIELTSPQLKQLFYSGSEEVDTEKLIDHKHLKLKISEILNTFDNAGSNRAAKAYSKRMKGVLIKRFGLDGSPPKSLSEVGNMFGIKSERVRQIEAKALRMLRHPTRSKHLKPFLDDEFDKIAYKKSVILTTDSKPVVEFAYCLSCKHNSFYKRDYNQFEMLYKCDLNIRCECISSIEFSDEKRAKRLCLNFKLKERS